MSVRDLPPLREALAAEGLDAKKRFGQHFLLDLNICRKIVRLARVGAGDEVLEIGPGPGGLTRALLEAGARVTAVERDGRFAPILAALAAEADRALSIVQADALQVDECALFGGRPFAIIANLPYNVGTPLLVKWLTGACPPSSMTLMFQREVARRIAARPGGEDYGRLAVLAQALCSVEIVMALPAQAFTPPPMVASAVVRLVPLAEPPAPALVESLQAVTRTAFGQRRKTLKSSLAALGGEDLCARAGVDPRARAETIPVGQFLTLAGLVAAVPAARK